LHIVRPNAPFLVCGVNRIYPASIKKRINRNNRRRNMKLEKWTVGLAACGLISLSPVLLAQTAAPTQIPMLTSLSATTISGYVDTSAVWNPGTGNAHPAPYAFNAGKQDGFNLNAVDIKISKPEDETAWSAGYVAEISYGPDAQAIDNAAYPIRQAYLSLNMPVGNGINWELGRFDGILGYESSDSDKNPNYTRTYGKTFEPTEHTGLLGSYKFNEVVGLQLGVADTLTTLGPDGRTTGGPLTAIESKKSLLSLLSLTAPDSWGSLKGSTLFAGFDYGQGAVSRDKKELYLGTTVNTPIKELTWGFSWDAIFHADVAGGPVVLLDSMGGVVTNGVSSQTSPNIDSGYFTAYAGYVSYKLTDKATLNGRAEYAQGNGLAGAPIGAGDVFNKVFDLTATLQYDLWANVLSRLELRWDHAAASNSPFGGDAADGGVPDKKNEVTLAANVIYKF
jgi:hypothetical protein